MGALPKSRIRRAAIGTVLGLGVIGGILSLHWLDRHLPGRSAVARLAQELRGNPGSRAHTPRADGTPVSPVPSLGAANPSENATSAPAYPSASLQDLIRFGEGDPRDIRVCENLGRSALLEDKGDSQPLDALVGENRADSLAEALRFPIRAAIREPSVLGVLREVGEMEAELKSMGVREKDGLLKRIGFYSRVAYAGATLIANKSRYELLMDRATHLMTLAKLAHRKPDLAESGQTQSLCREIEAAAKTDETTREDLQAERAKLLRLLADQGVEPAELQFDPAVWSKFAVRADEKALSFSLKTEGGPSPSPAPSEGA